MRNTLDLCRQVAAKQFADVCAIGESARSALSDDPPAGSYVAKVTDYARSITETSEREAALFVVMQTTEAVTRAVWNVRDHGVTFHAAIDDPRRPTTSLMTLARTMLEGTLTVAHLLEPVGPDLTITRGMAHWLDTMEGTLRTLRHVPNGVGPGTKVIEETIDEAYLHFGARGFRIQQSPKRPRETIRVAFRGAQVGLPTKITDLAARFLRHQPDLYPVLSGPAHSKNWFLGAAFQIGDQPGDFATYEQSWGAAVTAALDVSDVLVSSIGKALSLDVEGVLKQTHLRRRALLASVTGSHVSPISRSDFAARPARPKQTGGAAFGVGRPRVPPRNKSDGSS